MAIFKNEHEYMEEWLNHHITQGFDKFYLYCNDPNISNYSFLNKQKFKNYVVLIDWTNKKNNGVYTIQRQAYTHCVKNFSYNTQFLLMLDLDEFIIPINKYQNVLEYINSVKPKWNTIKAFKIQRYNFGSNYHIKKPKGLVVDNYQYHEKICSSYKTMANTDFIDKKKHFTRVHDFNLTNKNGYIYNDYLNYSATGFPSRCNKKSINEIPLVINHYFTKSYEEYLQRCKMWKNGGVNPIGYRKKCRDNFILYDINEIRGYIE